MFYDVFVKLCYERGISTSKAATEMGLNRSTVTFWKSDTYQPRQDTLKKVAEYFNVTVDYLLGNEKKPILQEYEISPKLLSIIERVQRLSPDNQSRLSELIDLYLNSQDNRK